MAAKVKIKSGKTRDLEGEFLRAWTARHPHTPPVQQLRFAKCLKRLWKFDFAWTYSGIRVAVEIDGAVFSGGRHSRGIGMVNDHQKLNAANLLGWRVLRFTVKDFETQEATDRMIQIVTSAVFGVTPRCINPELFPVRKQKKKSKKPSDPLPGYGVNLSALGLKRKK